MAAKIIENFIKMALFKKGGAIATDKAVQFSANALEKRLINFCLLYTSPSPRDRTRSRMPSSA